MPCSPVHSVRSIGVERAAEQFIVKARAENAALAVIERRAEFLIVLDLGDESLQFALCRVVARGDIVELIVDDIAFGEKFGPEIGLRLIVLEARDGAFEIGRHLGKAAGISCIAVAARGRVQTCVALHDIDNVEQVVVGRSSGDIGIGRIFVVEIIDL